MSILRGTLPRAASLASRHGPHTSLAPVSGVLGRYLPTPHAGPSRSPPLFRSPQSLRSRSATTLSSASPSSSVSPSLAPPVPPSRHSIKITTPSLESIKQEGFFDDDVALVPTEKAKLIITPEAVEQLARISAREPPDVRVKLALRVGVEGGGCHGYQYTMALTEEKGVDDYVFQPEGVDCIPVIVDLVSLGLVKGSTLHHATELIGSSFRIDHNPQAKQGGSCGCGVSWEAAEA
ncbi:[4Fe-4S] proteins maturation [Saitozyma podzolica]|uniref:[4Fe-4S] proteins maturation n=1 Tax=Saitozyma podzolica TaxID=1890683 RepID=A0A427XZ12_9TREE|nr:[4Fe-4S] proteins maturation [Saitozyma podzolica]